MTKKLKPPEVTVLEDFELTGLSLTKNLVDKNCGLPRGQQEAAMKTFFHLTFEGIVNLEVNEIWPDGNAPSCPTPQDVAEHLGDPTQSRVWSVGKLIEEWNLADCIQLTITRSGSEAYVALDHRLKVVKSELDEKDKCQRCKGHRKVHCIDGVDQPAFGLPGKACPDCDGTGRKGKP